MHSHRSAVACLCPGSNHSECGKIREKRKSKEEAAEAIGGEKKKRLEEAHPVLKFWTEKEKESVILYIKDYGQGIHPQDIGRILKKAIPEKIFITENINRQAWGFTWQKRLWSAWDIGLRQKASMGSTAGFR